MMDMQEISEISEAAQGLSAGQGEATIGAMVLLIDSAQEDPFAAIKRLTEAVVDAHDPEVRILVDAGNNCDHDEV